MSELLPRPVRLLIGATSPGVSDGPLRNAVEGKIVLITGASSGVGRATALRLARAGATVLLVARRQELLEQLRDHIEGAGGSAFVHVADLGDVEQAERLAAEVLEQHGHVDVVVSNAGVSIRRWISETYDRFRDIERTINVNYLGPVRLLLGLLDSMRERGSGHIVAVASIGVDFPPLRWSAYIASKTAFETWLAGVAPEIRADGVTTTSIHLQLVRSPMLGPFKMWSYVPGMSSDEAAGIVARAIVQRPRTIAPVWARLGSALTDLAQEPVEAALAMYSRRTNPDSRRRAKKDGRSWGGRGLLRAPLELADQAVGGLTTVASAGVLRPIRPDRPARALLALGRFGPGPAFVAAAAAELYADRPAVIDESGTLTFAKLDRQVRALAGALHRSEGLTSDDSVAVMCRNHRGFIQAAVAASRLGCDLVPLNTDFSATQLRDVLDREEVSAVILDQEFEEVLEQSGFEGPGILAWHDGETSRPTLEALIESGADEAPPPASHGRIVTLTSGTTGTPKGATRNISVQALLPFALGGLLDLSRIKPTPRSGDPIVVAPPLFHLFGFVGLMAGFGFGSPVVISRRFDAERILADVERHGASVLLAVPTMLGRIMSLPEEQLERYDCSSLRMLISGAAPLSPELSGQLMDHFGEVLYNGYASTEVGAGTIATPADLRAAPGTVGRPSAGVTVKILDDDGGELPQGDTGRVFVGSPLAFEGYTGGGTKQVVDGLMSTGDLGHFDAEGRLFIDGRDDDMIVSGGENVFPQEVEELLTSHDDVEDAAVFGVPDEDFGQRLAALVVRKAGASVSEEELKPYVRERTARYKVPREIRFVEELPRTSTGKLQRRRLSESAPETPSRS